MYLFCTLKLHLLKAYFITGWIVKKSLFPFSKIINNWDLYFNDTSLEYFVLLLYLVVFITIYVSTCFSSHWIKEFWYNFFHPPLFCGIDETFGLWEKLCNLKRLGGGGRFSRGWRSWSCCRGRLSHQEGFLEYP